MIEGFHESMLIYSRFLMPYFYFPQIFHDPFRDENRYDPLTYSFVSEISGSSTRTTSQIFISQGPGIDRPTKHPGFCWRPCRITHKPCCGKGIHTIQRFGWQESTSLRGALCGNPLDSGGGWQRFLQGGSRSFR